MSEAAPNDAATVALEFAGTSHRVLVRISTVDGRRRIDGWVVPGVRLRVVLGDQDGARAHIRQSTESDADGRFELTTAATGMVRLWLMPPCHGRLADPRRAVRHPAVRALTTASAGPG